MTSSTDKLFLYKVVTPVLFGATVLGILIPRLPFLLITIFILVVVGITIVNLANKTLDKLKVDFFSPVNAFSASYWFFYGIGLINLSNTWGQYVPPQIITFYVFGFIFFLVGVVLAGMTFKHWVSHRRYLNNWDISQKWFWFSLVILLVVGAVGVYISLRYRGGELFGDVSRLTAKSSTPIYVPYLYSLLELAGVILSADLFIRWHKKQEFPYINVVLLVIVLGMIVILLGSRHFVIPIGCGLVLGYQYFRKRIKLQNLLFIFLGALVSLSVWYGYRRVQEASWDKYLSVVEAKGGSNQWAWLAAPYLQARDASVLLTKIIDLFPKSYDYWYGRATFGPVLTVLPGKQWLADDWITIYIRGANLNAVGGSPPTILGGFYIDGGWLAVAIGMSLVGFVVQLSYLNFQADRNLTSLVFYSYILSFVCVSVYGYINLSTILLWQLICMVVLAQFLTKKTINKVRMRV